jgi:hypothetical protein
MYGRLPAGRFSSGSSPVFELFFLASNIELLVESTATLLDGGGSCCLFESFGIIKWGPFLIG